jgi:hypothetical protein
VIPETPDEWRNPDEAARWAKVSAVLDVVTVGLEESRRAKVIGGALDAWPTVTLPADFFAAYDAFGERRTGSPGDAAAAAWLRELAAEAGAAAEILPIEFCRFTPGPAMLEADGRSVAGLPLFDGGTTDASGVAWFRGRSDQTTER